MTTQMYVCMCWVHAQCVVSNTTSCLCCVMNCPCFTCFFFRVLSAWTSTPLLPSWRQAARIAQSSSSTTPSQPSREPAASYRWGCSTCSLQANSPSSFTCCAVLPLCSVQEVARVNSIAFHPSGDFILAGTDQPTCKCGGRE